MDSIQLNTIYNEDCLETMRRMPDGFVDLVLTDPPYGTTALAWDESVDLVKLWEGLRRIGTPGCTYIFTATQPFAADLVQSNRAWFKYELIYEKTNPRGFHSAKYMPLRSHENILVFCSGTTVYNPQMWECPPQYVNKRKTYTLRDNAAAYGGGKMPRRQESTSKYPRSVIPVSNHTPRAGLLHPTQKPLALFEYLVKTYSNAGVVVYDPFMGSGTTARACKDLGRHWIGSEISKEYCDIAEKRLKQEVFL